MGYGIIYGAYDREKDKWYIGQTIRTLDKRKKQHLSDAGKNGSNSYFHNVIRKYGENIFEWYVIDDTCENRDELNEMEFHYIQQYKSFGKNGYNLTTGGGGVSGYIHPPEIRKRISESNKGKVRTEEVIQKMREISTGKFASPETKQKMSESRIGILKGEKHPLFGKFHSEESKQKMSESKMGSKNSMFGRTGEKHPLFGKFGADNPTSKRYRIYFPCGDIVEVVGLNEFCRQHNLSQSNMHQVALGKAKQHKGFRVEKIG